MSSTRGRFLTSPTLSGSSCKESALCPTLGVVGFCRAFQDFLPVAPSLVLLLVFPFDSFTWVLFHQSSFSLGCLIGAV